MKDVMLDLETLGTRHDAMIVQIGACYFDRNTGEIGETFKANILYVNDGDKFSIDQGTVLWWLSQSEEARRSIMGDAFPLSTVMRDLYDFLDRDDSFLWSHATFDMPILANAFAATESGIKLPVPYRRMRDLRTLMDLADHHSDTPRQGVHHDALDDAKYQATYAAEAFRKLYGANI